MACCVLSSSPHGSHIQLCACVCVCVCVSTGARESAINRAEGLRQSKILTSEADKIQQINRAQGEGVHGDDNNDDIDSNDDNDKDDTHDNPAIVQHNETFVFESILLLLQERQLQC